MKPTSRLAIATLVGLLAACATTTDEGSGSDARPVTGSIGPLGVAFTHSAGAAAVPRDLLVAIAKVEDGLQLPAERVDLDEDNDVPAAGPLQLRRGKLDTLKRGAELVFATELDLRRHADLALEAGARVLAELGSRTGARGDDLASWSQAIEEMSGFADAPHRTKYAHEVFATLARGGSFEGRDGERIHLAPHDLPPTLTLSIDTSLRSLAEAQYPNTEWFPTSCEGKCQTGRGGNKVDLVLIHDTEGNWNASVATLQNDTGKSVQYIIGEDGRLGQFITEETTGYHAGNINYNQRSVGIEHVGFATKPFPEPLYAASAKLVAHLTEKYGIPKDRAHIIGHDQVPNGKRIELASAPCATSPKQCQSNLSYGGASHHTDPGVWEWPTFMARFGGTSKCNDVTNLWNCSKERAGGVRQAFRCIDDKVEVATCNGPRGCEVKELGVDDFCDVDPTKSTPTSESTSSPSEPTSESTDDDETPTAKKKGSSGYLGSANARASADAGGCSTTPSSSSPATFLVGLALACVLVRRRKP